MPIKIHYFAAWQSNKLFSSIMPFDCVAGKIWKFNYFSSPHDWIDLIAIFSCNFSMKFFVMILSDSHYCSIKIYCHLFPVKWKEEEEKRFKWVICANARLFVHHYWNVKWISVQLVPIKWMESPKTNKPIFISFVLIPKEKCIFIAVRQNEFRIFFSRLLSIYHTQMPELTNDHLRRLIKVI